MAKYIDELLETTLIEMMEEMPLNDITVTDLVKRANVNRKTFYNHFDGIGGLLCHIIRQYYEELVENSDDPDSWKDNLYNVMWTIQDNAPVLRRVIKSRYYPEVQLCVNQLLQVTARDFIVKLQARMEEKNGKAYPLTEQQVDMLVKIYLPLTSTLIYEWLTNGMKESIDEYIELVERILVSSLMRCMIYLSGREVPDEWPI